MKTRLIITPTIEAGFIIHRGQRIPYAGAILQDQGFDIQCEGYHQTIRSAVEDIADTVVWCLGEGWEDE